MITIQEVAQKRRELEQLTLLEEISQSAFDNVAHALPEYETLLEVITAKTNLRETLAQLETDYKSERIAEFEQTGEKAYPGGTVRVSKTYSYNDALIIPYLREHKHDSLIKESIDKTKVKKLADVTEVPGVTIEETVSATLNTDLSEFLES